MDNIFCTSTSYFIFSFKLTYWSSTSVIDHIHVIWRIISEVVHKERKEFMCVVALRISSRKFYTDILPKKTQIPSTDMLHYDEKYCQRVRFVLTKRMFEWFKFNRSVKMEGIRDPKRPTLRRRYWANILAAMAVLAVTYRYWKPFHCCITEVW